MSSPTGFIAAIIRTSLKGTLPVFIFIFALFAGLIALQMTPREEEPQIIVPMIDVLVSAPGIGSQQVERQVTTPLEKLLSQIPGVEHLYSTSSNGRSVVTVRFFVGEDREQAVLNTYTKLNANLDKIPVLVDHWQITPVEVDDVPILMFGLYSKQPDRYGDVELRRLADEMANHLQAIDDTSIVSVTGGRPRRMQILLDTERLQAHQTTMQDIIGALQVSNQLQMIGNWSLNNQSLWLESGDALRTQEQLENSVINIINGVPIYLRDVAQIIDGGSEPDSYQWIAFSEEASRRDYPMVTLSVAKQAGTNAVTVAENIHAEIKNLESQFLPDGVAIELLRDYGQTADDKVNQLTSSLAFAVITVVIFIAVFLGIRPAMVVGLAIPICYGVTLALDYALGYTINRVTLFALILSLGLLVDDPITGVDNIERHLDRGKGNTLDRIVNAIHEIRTPLLMSTLTIILAFIPLSFITGMMGPYMAPMAFNVPISVIVSTLVAFLVTPWLASKIIKRSPTGNSDEVDTQSAIYRLYNRILGPILQERRKAKWLMWGVLGLFLVTALLPMFRLVPLKLLPFDNKSELQVVIDLPEDSTLEQTAVLAKTLATEIRRLPEVHAVAAYVGKPSPMDFNGLVRHYYQRQAPNLADLRITLVDKALREQQSHAVVLRLRELLLPYSTSGITIRVTETPPGPPVLSTLVAEVYADNRLPYAAQQAAAERVAARLRREAHVVEVDTSTGDVQSSLRFVTDKTKAALSGIATADINQTLAIANSGMVVGHLTQAREVAPLAIELRLATADKTDMTDLLHLSVRGRPGIVKLSTPQGLDVAPQPLVTLGELGEFEQGAVEQPILHKDLKPVVYVTAEISGRTPAEVIADVHADMGKTTSGDISDWQARNYFSMGANDGWEIPEGISVNWGGEGEWSITLRVFRDLGLAFGFALFAIFIVLRIQTESTALSLIIMSSIPLTIIGIMPGFWLLNLAANETIGGAPNPVLFTATAMIGMIALAGIVVRNSLILVDFISQARNAGVPLREALIQAGAARTRPVLLTAGTTLLGNLVITLDPVFNGLALAIIFGIIASTLFTLFVVPVAYQLVFEPADRSPSHEPA